MRKILVILISVQTVPNVLFIKEMQNIEKIDLYVFISTPAMDKKHKVDHIIESCSLLRNKVKIISVINDSLENIEDKLENLEETTFYREDHFLVNLTCGTKIMTVGVYNFFKERNSIIYYLPIEKNIYKQLFPYQKNTLEFPVKYQISLKEYFTAYGIKFISKNNNKLEKSIVYTEKMFNFYINQAIDGKILKKLRLNRKKKQIQINKELSNFLDRISYEYDNNQFLTKNEIQYLAGGWFEEYCFNLIKEKLNLPSSALVCNLYISHFDAQNELDIAFIWNNALCVIECKTTLWDNNRNLINDTLYKIAALRRDFGLFVKCFLFTLDNNIRDGNGEIKEHIKNRTELLDIKIIDHYQLEKGIFG